MSEQYYFTVFTATYNRANLLHHAYESLCKQTYTEFLWVIMDDGSTDNTEKLVNEWIDQDRISIEYHRNNKNMGKYRSFNRVKDHFVGKMVVILDSDDMLIPDSLCELRNAWECRHDYNGMKPVGIVYNHVDKNGRVYGKKMPATYMIRDYELWDLYRVDGDKRKAYDRMILQKQAYPEFKGEKFIADSIIMNRIGKEGGLIVLDRGLDVGEYLSDGLSNRINRNHFYSPNGMSLYYHETMWYCKRSKLRKLYYGMKYIAFSKIAGKPVDWKDYKMIKMMMYIPGIMFAKRLINMYGK